MNQQEIQHQLELDYRTFNRNMEIAQTSELPLSRWGYGGAQECYKTFCGLIQKETVVGQESTISEMESALNSIEIGGEQ